MRIAGALILVMALNAQQPVARPTFSAVSVKLGDPAEKGSGLFHSRGGVQIRNLTLKSMLLNAYELNEYQVEGAPTWWDRTRFNIDGKLAPKESMELVPLMIQSMLADRFHLQVHRESKVLSHYVLVAATGGPKLRVWREGDLSKGGSHMGPRFIQSTGVPISTLTALLMNIVGAHVLDRTGLKDNYIFDLRFAPFKTPKGGETLPDIFTAIQEQLGLKLESVKAPMEVLVIDRAETPAEN